MADELVIPDANHERADNNLCKAQAILSLIAAADGRADARAVSNALWAADELVEEARNLYGKY